MNNENKEISVKKMRKPRTKKLTVINNQIGVHKTIQPENMIMEAMKRGASFEVMEKLLNLRDRIQKDQAEKAFREAMSKFQAECPIIVKSNNVDYTSKKSGTRVKYNYASLDRIITEVKGILGKYGLSYTFTTQQTPENVTAICHAFHIAGHTESTFFTIPIDPEAYMNAAQKVASALTYSKRYAFCNAFGILTGDEDNDMNDIDDKEKQKANEIQKEKDAKLDALPEYIKNGFRKLGYGRNASFAICEEQEWNHNKIKARLNYIADNVKQKPEGKLFDE